MSLSPSLDMGAQCRVPSNPACSNIRTTQHRRLKSCGHAHEQGQEAISLSEPALDRQWLDLALRGTLLSRGHELTLEKENERGRRETRLDEYAGWGGGAGASPRSLEQKLQN